MTDFTPKEYNTGDQFTAADETEVERELEEQENFDVAQIAMLRGKVQITDNCFTMPQGTGGNSGTSRMLYKVGISAVGLQLVFGNWTSVISNPQIDVDLSTSVTFKASIQLADGVNYPVTFNGLLTATVGPGAGPLVSDPIPVEVTKGDTIAVLVYVASGTYAVFKSYVGFTGGGGLALGVDFTAKGASAVPDNTSGAVGNHYGPCAIIGTPLDFGIPKAVVELGDSVAAGNDGGQTASAVMGYFASMPYASGGGFALRALTGEAGFIQASVGSDQLQWFNASLGHFRRANALRYARYAFIVYGHNDLGAGRTPAQLQQDLLTCCKRNLAYGIIKNFVMTLLPHSSSTDGWVTVENQTANFSAETNRVTHNTWVRDGGPIDPVTKAPVAAGTSNALRFGAIGHPIAGYVEVADVAESARNSGKWAASGRRVTDAAITASAATLTSATANFTSADVGRTVLIAGAGAAGAALAGTIKSVTNSTTAVLFANASTTVSAAGCSIGALTADGVHPYVTGHTVIGAAIKTPLLALMA